MARTPTRRCPPDPGPALIFIAEIRVGNRKVCYFLWVERICASYPANENADHSMNQETYDLLFSGELVAGFELSQVKKNIQMLFRIDEAKTDLLFSGKAVTLKKGLDAEAANKYRVAMKKAGARVVVIQAEPASTPHVQSKPPASSPDKPQRAAPGDEPLAEPAPQRHVAGAGESRQSGGGLTAAVGAPSGNEYRRKPKIEAPGYQVAEKGADMLASEYRLPVAEIEIDTSALSVAPQEGRLVREEELERAQPVQVNIPDIDVAPVGSDVLRPNERPEVQVVDVDISRLSLAQVGERLSEPEKSAPPPPNVDHIKLKN